MSRRPFLDLEARADIAQLLRQLAHGDDAERRAIVITTHDFDLAVQMADELWLIRQDGVLVSGSPDELAEQGAFDDLFSHPRADVQPRVAALRPARWVTQRGSWSGAEAALERRAGGVGALRLRTPCPVAQLVERAAVNR